MRRVAAIRAGFLLTTLVPAPAGAQVKAPPLSAIEAHDNLQSAGVLRNGELRLSLWAGMGSWSPKGPGIPALAVAALGEEGRALSVPLHSSACPWAPWFTYRSATRLLLHFA